MDKHPASVALLNEAAKYPLPNGASGFMYSNDELATLLTELSKHVSVGVHDVSNHGSATSMQITLYVTLDRDEYEDFSALGEDH